MAEWSSVIPLLYKHHHLNHQAQSTIHKKTNMVIMIYCPSTSESANNTGCYRAGISRGQASTRAVDHLLHAPYNYGDAHPKQAHLQSH